MRNDDNVKFIKEMFPEIDEKIIKRLLEATGNNIDLVSTKILDGTYKGIHFNIRDLYYSPVKQPQFKKDLYFPEVVNDLSSIKEEVDVEANRKEIKRLRQNIKLMNLKTLCHKNRLTKEYLREQKEQIKEDIDNINRETTLCIIKKSLQNPQVLDLHGLYTLDALKFVDDYITTNKPKSMRLVTGSEESSRSLRPSLLKYLKDKGYAIENEGPCIVAKRK